jgi:hypothetical protein
MTGFRLFLSLVLVTLCVAEAGAVAIWAFPFQSVRQPRVPLFGLPTGVRFARLIYLTRSSRANHDTAVVASDSTRGFWTYSRARASQIPMRIAGRGPVSAVPGCLRALPSGPNYGNPRPMSGYRLADDAFVRVSS